MVVSVTDLTLTARLNTPTNPKLVSQGFSSGERIFTAIMPDDSANFTMEILGSDANSKENQATTKGFRIKCFDDSTNSGQRFTETDFATRNYYVLIHSDDHKQHHFARITEIKTEDVSGDSFDFEPRIGKEIPKGSKFLIIKGELKTVNAIAISAGIKNDIQADLVVSRPLFYFHNERLDKKDQLDHNTKYYIMQNGDNTANSQTLRNFPSASGNEGNNTFRTVSEFGGRLKDYSKYSLIVKTTDYLRDLDNIGSGTITTNEGNSITADFSNYDDCLPNARRDTDDLINPSSNVSYAGPKRYIHYNYSPLKANYTYAVYGHSNNDAIDGKGGYSETSIIDNARILNQKIEPFTRYRVRHLLFRGLVDEWVSTGAKFIESTATDQYTFETDLDLETYLNDGDEIKVGNKILIVRDIFAISNGNQTIYARSEKRDETDGVFTAGGFTATVNDLLYRKAYNSTDKTILVDMDLIDGRFSKMFVSFDSKGLVDIFASVTATNKNSSLITLNLEGDSYSGNGLDYATGEFVIYAERFDGEIEQIENKKMSSQSVISLEGRDRFNKLLSPSVTKNSLFTEDIIYSTTSPYNKLKQIVNTAFTFELQNTAKTLSLGVAQSGLDNIPKVGDKLFTAGGYVGDITIVTTGNPCYITFTPVMTEANNEKLYIESEKNYMFTKALGTSHTASQSPTSLTGSADKGIFFTSGNKVSSTGAEDGTLVNTSLHNHAKAVGYAINNPSGITKKDRAFQAKLHDEYGEKVGGTTTYQDPATFDTVNTLIDFEVVSISKKDNLSVIELAPYVPVTLGRKTEYHFDVSEYTFTEVATVSNVDSENHDTFFRTASSTAYNLEVGESLFVGSTYKFVGKVSKIAITTTGSGTDIYVYLDRTIHNFTASEKVYTADKPVVELAFVNGSHLWGGKMVCMPHPKKVTEGLRVLNINNNDFGSGDFTGKYGQPLYRLTSMAKGSFDSNAGFVKDTINSNDFIYPKFYKNKTRMGYLGQGYQFRPNINNGANTNAFDKTDSSYRTLALDLRGINTPFGSKGTNTRIHATDDENIVLSSNLPQLLAKFANFDESASRLFIYTTSDLLPYSSKRTDSLMRNDKTLADYNLLAIEGRNAKDSEIDGGYRIQLKDSNFQTLSHNSTQDLSSLTRFGLMRLTEVCVDALFNLVNPEKPIPKQIDSSLDIDMKSRDIVALAGGGSVDEFTGSNNTTVTFDTAQTALSAGDKLFDADNGQYVAEISAGSSYSYTLTATPYLTQNGSLPNNLMKVITQDLTVKGRNTKNSFHDLDDDGIHPLKSVIVPKTSEMDGQSGSPIHYGQESGGSAYTANSGALSITDDVEVSLPFGFDDGEYASLNTNDSTDVKAIGAFSGNILGDGFGGMIGVALDRFGIEDGARFKVEKGNTTQLLKGQAEVTVGSTELICVKSDSDFHFKDTIYYASNAGNQPEEVPYNADGAYMVFKPRLWRGSGSSTDIKSSNGVAKKTTFSTNSLVNTWLKQIDITGCYLVPEKGTHISGQSIDNTTPSRTRMGTSISTSATVSRRMNNVTPSDLIHVISHEVSTSTITDHILITDKEIESNTAYRIMQPNEVCMYDFFPDRISLNMLSSQYTKVHDELRYYSLTDNYFIQDGNDISAGSFIEDEAILSMFVAVDTDGQTTDDGLVIKDPDNFFTGILPQGEYSLYFSDGEVGSKISVTSNTDASVASMTLSERPAILKGIVSVSEPFTISTFQELKINPTRMAIGSTITAGLESEDLVNELFEENDITFTVKTEDTSANKVYPYYLAPNFKGVDLYSAVKSILDKKDMILIEENETFNIIPNTSSFIHTDIVIDDSTSYDILNIQRTKSMFDFYNEIVVFGNVHKGHRRDFKSIQKRGRKTLTVVDDTLLTQEEVNVRASLLLSQHSQLNEVYELRISSRGIEQIRAGDIIQLDIPREQISRSEFLVIQVKHSIQGFMVLTLGKYMKGLDDLFSELIVASKQTRARFQLGVEDGKEITTTDFVSTTVKPLRLLARKRVSAGATLGFESTLNVSSQAIGFEGGGVTVTDLLDEEGI